MMKSDPASTAHSKIRLSGVVGYANGRGRLCAVCQLEQFNPAEMEPTALPSELIPKHAKGFIQNRIRDIYP
jgi:hypothetical protein